MKTLFTLLLLLTSVNAAFAQTDANANLPLCNKDGPVVAPCRLNQADSFRVVTDMMFGNRKGFDEISKKAPGIGKGLTAGFLVEDARASMISETEEGRPGTTPIYKSVSVYEVLLNDCRGTDACNGHYLWTVTETGEGDGYTYSSKYENKIEKTDLDHLNPESDDAQK